MKKKGTLIAAVSVIAIAVGIGITFAISQSNSVINNAISVSKYETVTTDTFTSPRNWQPGETIPKTITVKNNSNVPVSVRIKLEEEWVAADGVTKLPVVSAASGLTMALIDYTEDSGWVKDGPFYVYEADLQPNATTTSLITGVTLNTDANLDTSDNAEPTADTAYAGAEYHLRAIIQTIQASAKENWRELARIVKEKSRPDTVIDFSQKANKWDDNGLGVNRYTENGQDVYYYRGEMDGDNVLWANKCWVIVRTTYTGGTKMIYNGLPTDVDVDGETVKQCLVDRNNNNDQSVMPFSGYSRFNNSYESPADIGYMYGQRYLASNVASRDAGTIYANDVDYDENTGIYTLVDTFTVTEWDTDSTTVAQRYHYTCSSTTTSCQQVYYMVNVGKEWTGRGVSSGIILSGEKDIEEVKEKMFANVNDSYAKANIENWFEQENLDGHIAGSYNYEDDLEDAIFCNDRSFATGTLRSKDSEGGNMNNYTTSYLRIDRSSISQSVVKPFTPDLGCPNKNDAFTKDETATTNGKLKHKVGLLTADEILLAGIRSSTPNFINSNKSSWTMTPYGFSVYAYVLNWSSDIHSDTATSGSSTWYRPVVSLKAGTRVAGGDGTKTNPYTIQY